MKVFLAYKDRDFDPQQLLIRRERDLRYSRGGNAALDLRQALPWNEAALRQDLGLDLVLDAMSCGDTFLFEAALVAILSSLTAPDAIRYRQHVLADCLRNAAVVHDIYRIALEAIEGERKNYWGSFGRYPSGTLHHAVEVLQMFVGQLKRLRQIAEQQVDAFASEGFSTLFAMLRRELSEQYFAAIEQHLRRLKFRHGTLISARLGPGNKGADYVLRRPHEDRRAWLVRLFAEQPPSYSFKLHPRDEGGARALAELNDRGVNLAANALAQSTDHILSFFQMLRTELAFYIGGLNLHARLGRLGAPVCFPSPGVAGQIQLTAAGLYDASLALSAQKRPVPNDLDADGKDIVIITGANTGGKSTFLRSVGLAQLMMQAGLFVPATAFSSEVCAGLYTHFKREEDQTLESGKWDEELSRMCRIVDQVKPHSMLLCNESFASTNEREGSQIAGQIVRALLDSGIKVLFVTHLYHFARGLYLERSERAVFLRAGRRPDGTRSFRLLPGEPLQTSYGEDVYQAVFGTDGTAPGGDASARRPADPAAVPSE